MNYDRSYGRNLIYLWPYTYLSNMNIILLLQCILISCVNITYLWMEKVRIYISKSSYMSMQVQPMPALPNPRVSFCDALASQEPAAQCSAEGPQKLNLFHPQRFIETTRKPKLLATKFSNFIRICRTVSLSRREAHNLIQ